MNLKKQKLKTYLISLLIKKLLVNLINSKNAKYLNDIALVIFTTHGGNISNKKVRRYATLGA